MFSFVWLQHWLVKIVHAGRHFIAQHLAAIDIMAFYKSHLSTQLTFKKANQSKQSIIWILLLLVSLFITCILIISSLNLRFSQKAMSDLREDQLQEAFYANRDRIDDLQHMLEFYTDDLAVLGLVFGDKHEQYDPQLKQKIADALAAKLRSFPEAFGVGLWFELDKDNKANPLSTFAYRNSSNNSKFSLITGTNLGDYQNQPWFKIFNSRQQNDSDIYWTSAYYSPLSNAGVLTLIKPIINGNGKLLGMVSTDWHAERIIDLVSQIKVTPNTVAYLIDRNNRKLSGLHNMDDPQQAQKVMDRIQREKLFDSFSEMDKPLLSGLRQEREAINKRQITVDGRAYDLSYAITRAGMLFGIGVPRDEIDAVLSPMRNRNYTILLFSSMVMLILSSFILFRVMGLMRMLHAAYQDELTKLPNRACMLLDFNNDQTRALILLNLDDFKEINGLFGHHCGDYALKILAQSLSQFLQAYQVQNARLYRLTADEFAILVPPMSENDLVELLQNIHQNIHHHSVIWQQQEINLRISLGAAIDSEEVDEHHNSLVTRAKFALQQARKQEKSFVIYQNEQRIEDAYEYNLLWAGRVKDALQQDRILPYFQAIYDNASDRITKYECLVRMQLEDGSIANPGQFLDVARKVRLDRLLTKVMVEKSFTLFTDQNYEFSINLSYADLLDEDLTHFILKKLDEKAIGQHVIFEILESDGIDNYDGVIRFIDDVKQRGCRIAIDDFGTGYSNFEHLLRLNVDIIKIDGSLIRNLDKDQTAFDVTQGIVKFAQSLNMATVAEFVHCEAVQQKVRELGIDFSQGYYISMPLAELVAQDQP